MDKQLQPIVQTLEKEFDVQVDEFCDEVQVLIEPEHLVAACQKLRDEFDFKLLSTVTAVDYWPQETPRFHIIYQLNAIEEALFLMLRVQIGRAHV